MTWRHNEEILGRQWDVFPGDLSRGAFPPTLDDSIFGSQNWGYPAGNLLKTWQTWGFHSFRDQVSCPLDIPSLWRPKIEKLKQTDGALSRRHEDLFPINPRMSLGENFTRNEESPKWFISGWWSIRICPDWIETRISLTKQKSSGICLQ